MNHEGRARKYIPHFFRSIPPRGYRQKPFPTSKIWPGERSDNLWLWHLTWHLFIQYERAWLSMACWTPFHLHIHSQPGVRVRDPVVVVSNLSTYTLHRYEGRKTTHTQAPVVTTHATTQIDDPSPHPGTTEAPKSGCHPKPSVPRVFDSNYNATNLHRFW